MNKFKSYILCLMLLAFSGSVIAGSLGKKNYDCKGTKVFYGICNRNVEQTVKGMYFGSKEKMSDCLKGACKYYEPYPNTVCNKVISVRFKNENKNCESWTKSNTVNW